MCTAEKGGGAYFWEDTVHTYIQAPLKNAVVIGGSGYLGKRLVKQLLDDGNYQVHSLDLTIPPDTKRHPGVRSYIQTDITEKEHVKKALRGMDVVFHTASTIPAIDYR